VKHRATDDAKWTCNGVYQRSVTNGFALNAVFLCGEVESHIVGLEDAFDWCSGSIVVGCANGEGDVAESEGV
jgi:hypothetical protein